MRNCPCCGAIFSRYWGFLGASEDGQREMYCSEECRDRTEAQKNQQSAARSRWKAPESFPWDSTDPFAE
jgi:hypothetical protein